MGKRSNFARKKNDFYETWDRRALPALLSLVPTGTKFFEPCVGSGELVHMLEDAGLECTGACDIDPKNGYTQGDALDLTEEHVSGADCILTNPPWTRQILHPMIEHFSRLKPTFLLFDANWVWTKQAGVLLDSCVQIVATPRLQWMRNTRDTATDDTAWYHFDATHTGGPILKGRVA